MRNFFKTKHKLACTYRIRVVSLAEEFDNPHSLPLMLQYIRAKNPELFGRLRQVISGGKAIGVRTVLKSAESVLTAVNEISVRSQHRMILTWLPSLLWDQQKPHITDTDR